MREKLEPKTVVLWVRGGKEWNVLVHTITSPLKADGLFHIALKQCSHTLVLAFTAPTAQSSQAADS